MRIKYLLSAVLVTVGMVLSGAPKFQFRSYASENGLPSNTILSMAQDHNGMIWVGTSDGICSFDGLEFIRHDLLFEGENKGINSLVVDSDGDLWIGTDNAFHCPDKGLHRKFSSVVVRIVEDNDRNMWVSTWEDGLFRINLDTGDVFCFDRINSCETIFIDSHNIMWVCCSNGEILMRGSSDDDFKDARLNWQGTVPQRVVGMVEEDNSDLCMVTWDAGVMRLERASMSVSSISDVVPEGFTHTHNVLAYKHSELLISSDDGLVWYHTRTGESHLYPAQRFSYPVLKDIEGGIWVGTYYGGLFYSSINSGLFDSFPLEIHGEPGIVSSLCEDEDGTVWAGTDNFGLINFSPKDGSIIKRYLPDGNVHALLIDGSYLWIGSYAGGLYRLDRRNGSVKCIISGRSVYRVFIDSRGVMWVATMGDIMTVDRSSGEILSSLNILDTTTDIVETEDGSLWFATNAKGLFRYRISDDTWHEYRREEGLPDDHVNSISVLDHERLLVATASGLASMSIHTGSFEEFDFCEGKNILFVSSDGDNLWLSTTEGICRHTLSDGKTEVYTLDDGLSSLQFLSGAGISTSNGRIILGTSNGVSAFYPHSIHINEYVPPVLITRFRVREKSRKASGTPVIYENVDEGNDVVFSHNRNNFAFSFASLSYTSPLKNRYMYMLDGFDGQWRISEGNRAEYTNIPAGKYTFRVKASNNDGVWNESGASVSFTVKPHFLKSKTAMIVYLVLVVSMIIVLARMLQKRINIMSEEKYNSYVREYEENERARRDKDMIEKLNDIIAENISNADLSADYLARELCVSRSGLFAKVKEVTGKTPHDMVQEARLHEAIRLLESSDTSVNDISSLVGFNSPSYFSKCFTKEFGCSPYNWRKNARKDLVQD